MIDANTFNIASSLVSSVLAIVAIILSIWFFILSKNTESRTAASLAEIKTQTEMLNKITGKQIDRFSKYFTEQKPNYIEESLPSLITMFANLPTQLLQQNPPHSDRNDLLQEITLLYSVLYFYTAQTNYWCQFYLPGHPSEFDITDSFHTLTKRIVDTSASDFEIVAKTLPKFDINTIQGTGAFALLTETKDRWKNFVKTTDQYYHDK